MYNTLYQWTYLEISSKSTLTVFCNAALSFMADARPHNMIEEQDARKFLPRSSLLSVTLHHIGDRQDQNEQTKHYSELVAIKVQCKHSRYLSKSPEDIRFSFLLITIFSGIDSSLPFSGSLKPQMLDFNWKPEKIPLHDIKFVYCNYSTLLKQRPAG